MSKVSLERVNSSFGFQAAFNRVLEQIEEEFSERVLYRDNPLSEANSMNSDLDMAGNDVINIGTISAKDFRVGGADITNSLQEAINEVAAYPAEAKVFRDEAEAFRNDAAAQVALTTAAGAAQVALAEDQVALAVAQVALAEGHADDAGTSATEAQGYADSLSGALSDIILLDGRMDTAESDIIALEGAVSDLETDKLDAAEIVAPGGAPKYVCRAWANFDGTTTPPTIRASGNVSSVVKNGTGDYTINFVVALPTANYVGGGIAAGSVLSQGTVKTTTAFRVIVRNTASSANFDWADVNVFILI
jgi:hypothetical protein